MPSHISGEAVPEEKKDSMYGSAQLQPCQAVSLQHSPAWTDPEAQLGTDSHHSQWSCHVVTGTFSCGLRGCGSKFSAQPEQLPIEAPHKTHRYILGLMPSSLTEKPRELQAVRGHSSSAHTKPALCFSSTYWFAAHFANTLGSLPQGESLSVPTTMDSSHH